MRPAVRIALVGVIAILVATLLLTQFDVRPLLVVVALVAVAVAAATAVYAAMGRERSHGVRRRVRGFVGTSGVGLDDDDRVEPAVPYRSLRQRSVDLIAPEAEIAGIEPRLGHILLGTAAAGLVLGVVTAILIGSAWGLVAGLAAPVVTRSVVKRRVSRTRKLFEQQLPDNLDVVSSALRVGHSLAGAFAVTVEAADEPSRKELGRAVADEQLGVPLDIALLRVADRMKSQDIEQVALVTRLQRDAGTNAAEVLDQVSENVRGRMDVERLVRTLTAQGRMARWIVSLLPVFLFGAMYVLNREYLAPLWDTAVGKAGLCVAIVMICAGSLIIKKIVEIEV